MQNKKLELGVSTILWLQESLISQLPIIKEFGIKFIEVSGLPVAKHFNYQDTQSWEELASVMSKCRLKAHSLHVPTNSEFDISALNENTRKFAVNEVTKSIDMFFQLEGAKVVIVHPSAEIEDIDTRKSHLRKCKESLKKIVECCEDRKLKVAIENMLPGRIGSRIEELLGLIDSLHSEKAGICLDTGHTYVSGINPTQALRRIGHKLFALHIADNFGKEDDHLLPFEGRIDWANFMGELRKLNRCPVFMFETKERKGKLSETLKKMKEIFVNLQKFL